MQVNLQSKRMHVNESYRILDTGIKLIKNVNRYNFGFGFVTECQLLLNQRREDARKNNKDIRVVFFFDEFFKENDKLQNSIGVSKCDKILIIPTDIEPKTDFIDNITFGLLEENLNEPCAIVGIGGGVTLDTSKAVSNLLTNGGKASDYQGWDLVKQPGIFKIGIPTISGTGAEATRTCVITNEKSGLKLGMNSDFTVFDHIIMDPGLSKTVPRNQYFFTGMDAYIHCIESLKGNYRNAIGDAFSRETIRLCREVFSSDEMMCDKNREKLMVASYMGGCAIASSYVGIIHPFSAGLSVVLGIHHCIGNCIAMRAMNEYYPNEFNEFWSLTDKQRIEIPDGICENLSLKEYEALYNATIIHEKPLTNALGSNYKKILTFDKVVELFRKM